MLILSSSSWFLKRLARIYITTWISRSVLKATDSSSLATLSTSRKDVLIGELQSESWNGQFVFSEFTSLAEPGSNFTVTISV